MAAQVQAVCRTQCCRKEEEVVESKRYSLSPEPMRMKRLEFSQSQWDVRIEEEEIKDQEESTL